MLQMPLSMLITCGERSRIWAAQSIAEARSVLDTLAGQMSPPDFIAYITSLNPEWENAAKALVNVCIGPGA